MRNLIVLLFATLLFASCSNVAFKEPQPEFLEPLTEIPEKFQGVFVVPEMFKSVVFEISDFRYSQFRNSFFKLNC